MKKTVKNFEKTIVNNYIEWKHELEYLREEIKTVHSDCVKEEIQLDINITRNKVELLYDLISELEIDISLYA